MSAGSTSNRVPSPSHRSHAPYGELNEKLRGASSSNDKPSCMHARCSENVSVSDSPPSSRREDLDLRDALGETQRGLERVGEAPLDARATHEAVDDDLDRVVLVAGEPLGTRRQLGQLDQLAVDPGPREALLRQLAQHALVLALAAPHHRREHLEAGAVGELQHAVDDLLRRLTGDHPPALRAVRDPDARVEQPQVVVDLGDRPDRGARVARRRLLVDRDRRRQPLDEVDVGLVHLAEELPRVGRERLDVAPLSLGVDRVERQRRLARAGQPGEHDQLVAWQLEIDVAEVVLTGAADGDRVGHRLASVPRSRPRTNACSSRAGRRGPACPRVNPSRHRALARPRSARPGTGSA